MAHARLGHGDEGRRWLDRLRRDLAGSGQVGKGDDPRGRMGLWTYFRAELHLLLREAEAVNHGRLLLVHQA